MSAHDSKIVRNLTPKRLHIKGANGKLLVLAPLEKNRSITKEELEPFDYQRLESQNLISVSDVSKENLEEKLATLLPVVGTLLFFGFSLGHAFTKSLGSTVNTAFWVGAIGLVSGILVVSVLAWWMGKSVLLRLLAQSFSLVLILAVGIGLPAATIFYFGGGREFFASRQLSLVLLGRALQLVFIITASLLPALLFFLFDRQQLGTLRDRFEHQIFRLDPNVETLVDVQARYGRQIGEIYGPVLETNEGRLIRGTRWPIFVATVVITMGWILALMPVDANLTVNNAGEIANLLVPGRKALIFGFLGVYFFALNMSLLRYARADLKPKAYSSIAVRFFIVVISAWVIGLTVGEGNLVMLAIAFMVGIFPESAITVIREFIRNEQSAIAKLIPYPKEEHPLTDLEGIDIYDRSRLADEGVTNIEALAHHDLIDLMLETRIPVPRLLDWLDQAILYLHLTPSTGQDPTRDPSSAEAKNAHSLRDCLRFYGIRTATDLMTVDKEKLFRILGSAGKENQDRLEIALSALADDEWVN
ncbi:MAG TPA: hypothetical protein VHQ94_04475, partial [Pyrinomonadaceae bacterium]|nr:hypothetical protein [Pyrinomonadaceae bacterium]